jgi:DNA phosphorothioation-dependent restriction protein DptG
VIALARLLLKGSRTKMVQTLKRDDLKNLLYSKRKHDQGKALDVLPFLSKRTGAIKNQFNKVLGEYIRYISGVKFNEKALIKKDFYLSEEENELSEHIASTIDWDDDEEAAGDFVRFLDQFLFNQEELRPIHPYLFNYIKLDKNHKNEFGKYAQFMNEVLVGDDSKIRDIFNNKESDDVLTELILEKMGNLEDKSSQRNKKQYEPILSSLVRQYKEDLLYLSKYKDYFLSSFPLLTHYYVFMYACQLLIKFEQFTNADYKATQPLYFALDWESITKRRKPADEFEGYKFIKERSIHLFPHIHTISHLSHNDFNMNKNDDTDKVNFIPYSTLYKEIHDKGPEYEKAFLNDLKQWISDYSELFKVKIVDRSETIPDAFEVLFTCLREGMSTTVCDKYGKNIDDLGANQFLKNRGALGPVLNVKHDFLLLLTAVSVKDKRIPLNDLFVEFEKRGVKFDRYSKKEILTLFDKQNLLDKKSDSGDAQYVKPIL